MSLDLLSFDEERHAFERLLNNLGRIVGDGANTVVATTGMRVLQHHFAVAVVEVGEGKGLLLQSVEERLLGVKVVLEGLVVVQMVARQVGKDATIEVEPADALLIDRVA